MVNGKKIGISLSGGGAKGFAHIGVLKVLESNGIKPDIVVGTSMGSIIGGLYASGMTIATIEKKAKNFKLTEIVDVNVFNIVKQGVIAGNKLMKYISKLAKNGNIENFPTKFACVACDLKTGKEIIFDKGSISVATRASSSIPGIFAPYKKDGMILIDGGVINNNPSELAYKMGADYVIDVDCIGKAYLIKDIKNTTDILMSSFSLTQFLYNKKSKKKVDAKIVLNNFEYSYFEHSKAGIVDIIRSGEIAATKIINKIKNDINVQQ